MPWREHLWTIIFATLLSLLIWLWAEGENRETGTVNPVIEIVLTDPLDGDREVFTRIVEEGTVRKLPLSINIDITGPRRNVEQAKTSLRNLDLVLESANFDDDTTIEDLLEIVAAHPKFEELGVTAVSVDPQELTFRVFITETVPIRWNLSDVETSDISFDPDSVRVTMWAVNWSRARSEFPDGLFELAVVQSDIDQLKPGRSQKIPATASLKLDLVSRLGADMQPTQRSVIVTLTPTQLLDSHDLDVSVKLNVLPENLSEFDITLATEHLELKGVRCTGAETLIESLRNKQLNVRAFVDLSTDDLIRAIGGELEKEVEVLAPPGVTVSFPMEAFPDLIDGQRPRIPIVVKRRSPTPPE